MKSIKQINPIDLSIDHPLNKFIKSLPYKGEEIVRITYITSHSGQITGAIVEYEEDSKS